MSKTTKSSRNIVIGQKVDPVKAQRARELRQKMTPAEKILWRALRANRLDGFHFRRQQVIDGFIVDFYCHASRLVVEIDGDVHARQLDYDAERDRVLLGRELRIMRIPNDEVMHNLSTVLDRIAAACRGADTPPRVGEGQGEGS